MQKKKKTNIIKGSTVDRFLCENGFEKHFLKIKTLFYFKLIFFLLFSYHYNSNVLILKIIFKNKKYIILIYFKIKNILKKQTQL